MEETELKNKIKLLTDSISSLKNLEYILSLLEYLATAED